MAKNVVINGVVYQEVPQVEIPLSGGSGDAVFYDTTGATADASKVLAGETVYGANGLETGSMVNNGAVNQTITTKAQIVTIAEGYHSGSGKVQIATAQQNLIVSGNIRSGVSLLGVSGKASVVDTADANATAGRIANGYTAYVNGSKVTGTLTSANVSQDTTTKVLTIS